MNRLILLACAAAVLCGCASKQKEPSFLVVDSSSQIVADVYIRNAGSSYETQTLGGAAYRQSEIMFSLNEGESTNISGGDRARPAPVRDPGAASSPKPKSSLKTRAKTAKKIPSKGKPKLSPKTPVRVKTPVCPPVQVITETIYCSDCSEYSEGKQSHPRPSQ